MVAVYIVVPVFWDKGRVCYGSIEVPDDMSIHEISGRLFFHGGGQDLVWCTSRLLGVVLLWGRVRFHFWFGVAAASWNGLSGLPHKGQRFPVSGAGGVVTVKAGFVEADNDRAGLVLVEGFAG